MFQIFILKLLNKKAVKKILFGFDKIVVPLRRNCNTSGLVFSYFRVFYCAKLANDNTQIWDSYH